MKKIISLIFISTLLLNCYNSNKILRTTYIEPSKNSIQEKKIILLHLYPENGIRKISLKTNDNKMIFNTLNSENLTKNQLLEIEIPTLSRIIIAEVDDKRLKIKLNNKYKFLYIEPRNNKAIEVVHTNRKPIFTD